MYLTTDQVCLLQGRFVIDINNNRNHWRRTGSSLLQNYNGTLGKEGELRSYMKKTEETPKQFCSLLLGLVGTGMIPLYPMKINFSKKYLVYIVCTLISVKDENHRYHSRGIDTEEVRDRCSRSLYSTGRGLVHPFVRAPVSCLQFHRLYLKGKGHHKRTSQKKQ